MTNQEQRWPKLLVLTGSVPGTDGVGAILIKQILDQVPRSLLRIIGFTKRTQGPSEERPDPGVDLHLTRRFEPAYRPLKGLPGELASFAAQQTLGRNYLNKLSQECVASGEEFGCEGVLAVMDNPSVIRIAEQVSRKLNVPLYSFVMDDPALQAHDFGFGHLLTSGLQRSFDSAMMHSRRIAVAGEAMQHAYIERFGKAGSILRQSPPRVARESILRKPMSPEKLIIGFAGSLTARDTYDQLIAELDRRNWMISEKKVIFRIIGAHLKLIPSAPQHIEYFGWRSIPDLVKLSAECDFLYLPQSFSKELRAFTALSFPNKLCTYLPVRRPIILHTPSYGSLGRFFAEFPCGPVSHEFRPEKLLDEVESVALDESAYRKFQEAIEHAMTNVINEESFKYEVRAFLGSN